jgi:N-acetylneuraminic acid mutarotase
LQVRHYALQVLMFDAMLSQLETDLRTTLGTCIAGLVATARARLEDAYSDIIEERAKGLAEVTDERAKALAEVDVRRTELGREVAAMHKHTEAQEGRVELNIGGYRFETSVQTLRRVSHTFFDAYFSGRYAQDVCNDGSVFVDRDGEHFNHVLEYMRDGVVSMAEAGAHPSVSLLRALKREFGFYCIELSAKGPAEPAQPEMAFVIGGMKDGNDHSNMLSTVEQYDASSSQWSAATNMGTRRFSFGACAVVGEVYVTGGMDDDFGSLLASVEKYSPSTNTWSSTFYLPEPRSEHAAVAVGSAMYVFGGILRADSARHAKVSVLKLDSIQGIWSVVAPMPEPRYSFPACVVGSDIYVFGGRDNTNRGQGSVFKYDTENDEWSTLAPMSDAEFGHSATELYGLIYILGAGEDCREVLRYDPASGVWSTLAPLIHERYNGASFVLAGCVYAAGGRNSESKVQRYDVTADEWRRWRTCSRVVASLVPSQLGLRAPPRIRTSSTHSSSRLPGETFEFLSSQSVYWARPGLR